jgi:hypothetical protein
MTLPQFWAMIFGKQIVWDERARGRDKLAQRWVQRLRFSDTHLGLANLAQLLINALTREVESAPISMSGKATNQDLAPWSNDKFQIADHAEVMGSRAAVGCTRLFGVLMIRIDHRPFSR